MKWFLLVLFMQFIMWGAPEEPPGMVEGGPPEPMMHAKEKCEQNKNQLESLKEIMLRNKQSLKKKEEEVQEYARRLSKIKSRAKLSRRSKEGTTSSKDSSQLPKADASLTETPEQTIDDISQAKTPKAKSNLLQKKLAENRKVFEQRSKEITESKRAVEEKVEAIRQQLEEKDQLSITPIRPLAVASDTPPPVQIGTIQDKENKIAELTSKILELEATVLDLQENLKEKDSVIDSKTKAVTLMSADLSKKGKTTLDTLEDTKDEMRTMQEHFVLLETSLKNKNESLLQQLKERDNKISEMEDTIKKFEEQMDEQKVSASATIDFSRSTMDALVETKDAMKSMQENFVLIESSLKAKNENLLQQLQDYELKLAEANERVFQLESGMGIEKSPSVDDLQFKIEKLEQSNKQLQDEKYELQKSIAEMQDKIVSRSVHGNGAIIEKDNRIAELENLVEELKQSNKLLEEESKAELQKQLADLTLKNEEYSNRITELEKSVHDLEAEKTEIAAKLPDESTAAKEDEKVLQLTKELEELNKTMIKIKAQHRSKVKNLQKQLENFKMVSDTNAELVRLGNQVAILEEEKASAGDWQERIADLETKVSAQTKEIQMHIEAIATLENQKLDLMQELHMAKQEVSALEAENAESENLRVTAEMKVVDLEEQLESVHKAQKENKVVSLSEAEHTELLKKIEALRQENIELYNRLSKMDGKAASDSGSTESFEAIQDSDKTDLLKKIEDLTQKNSELTDKLSKLEEKSNSQAGSTESFETINDTDKNDLLKKIDQLTQENTDLTMKLNRIEEKGSSDTGSTESFERIPEHSESMTKIELLTQENQILVIKLTKLEEELQHIEHKNQNVAKLDPEEKTQLEALVQENNNQSQELIKLREQIGEISEENNNLQKRIEALIAENSELAAMHTKHEDRSPHLEAEPVHGQERSVRDIDTNDQIDVLVHEKNLLEKEVKELRNALEQANNIASGESEISYLQLKVDELLDENARIFTKLTELEEVNKRLKDELNDVTREKDELRAKIQQMTLDDFASERHELIDKLERLNQETESVAQERQKLQAQINTLLHKSTDELSETRKADDSLQQTEPMIVASMEREIEDCKRLIAEQSDLIEDMKLKLNDKEKELEEKHAMLKEYEISGKKAEYLEGELKEILNTIEEWKYKCNEMQSKMEVLEEGKASIEEGFRMLQSEHDMLLDEAKDKQESSESLQQQLKTTISTLLGRLQEQMLAISVKEREIATLKETINNKTKELDDKYGQLQNEMILADSLQDELNTCKMLIQEKNAEITSLTEEVEKLNSMMRNKDEEIYSLRKEIVELQEMLQGTKPREEYNALFEEMGNKDTIINEIQNRLEESEKEKCETMMKLQKLLDEKQDYENQLAQQRQQFADLVADKNLLDEKIAKTEIEKSDAEKRIWELQNIMENNAKFVEDLQKELKDGYKHMEQLKLKHTEDMEMQNRRLEVLIEELNAKTQENEALKSELEEKERMVGQNVTEEVKIALEAQVADLQQQLAASEEKIQEQIRKMKKIAANLNKRKALCQELEARVAELEEKWTTEKDEKEAKNKQIQEVEISIREKDNRIVELEDKLSQARTEATEAITNLEKLTSELNSSKEKMSLLTEQITEMEEEIVRLRHESEACTAEITAEKQAKETVQANFESYRQQVIQENERKQSELEEVKEKARELSVRMQVMEAEYVEHLALINNLKTENGLLLSKQAQINEKLENVEKESEERALLIEQLQKEIVNTTEIGTQAPDEVMTEEESKVSDPQQCHSCEQCQTLVQALEAKLQEREAEITNLDNELANSVGNLVQMRESARFNDLMNQTASRNSSLEDSYNDLLFQYNTLTSSNEELQANLSDVLKENKELMDKIESLQNMNVTLEDRIQTVEQELIEGKEKAERLHGADLLNADLTKQCEDRERTLLTIQDELQAAKLHADQLEQQLNAQISTLEAEKQDLTQKEKLLTSAKENLEQEIEVLKMERDSNLKKVADLELELRHRKEEVDSSEGTTVLRVERSVLDNAPDDENNAPQLFDASKIFGTSSASDPDILSNEEVTRLQSLLHAKEAQCSNLTQEIDHLKRLMAEERSQLTQDCNRCADELKATQERLQAAQAELQRLEGFITEKNVQIDSLHAELSNVDVQIMAQCNQQDDSDTKLEELVSLKDNQINELKAELNSTTEILEVLTAERDQQIRLLDSNRVKIANLEAELRTSTDTELIQELEQRISETLKERDLLQLQVNDLSRSMEELQTCIESRRNLQVEMENALREKNEAKEIAANLMRALEDIRKGSTEQKAEESTVIDASAMESTTAEEHVGQAVQAESAETSKPVEEHVEQSTSLNVGSSWDTGSAEKLMDEEMWDWNSEDVQLADQQLTPSLIPNEEARLRAMVDDLQDRIKDLEGEKEKIIEENKAAQARSGKLVKKLKEYKVQIESLQHQLKTQKSASDFYELDSAIEEELKAQITMLEKSLKEAKEEQKTNIAEKEALLKRLDVVVSANERYMEMKEKQDMELEVLRIQNKELNTKIETLDRRLQENMPRTEEVEISQTVNQGDNLKEETAQPTSYESRKQSAEGVSNPEVLCKKYKDEIDDLKDEMEALATENEQLQHILEDLKIKLTNSEKRLVNEKESAKIIDELNNKNAELQSLLKKSQEDYDVLQKQYEQSLMDANGQVSAMRDSVEILKAEAIENTTKLEIEIQKLQQQVESSDSRINDLTNDLQNVLQEKACLEEKVSHLTATEEKLSSVNVSLAEVTDLLNVRIQEVADLKQELQRQYIDREEAETKLQNAIHSLTQELSDRKQELDSLRRSFSEREKELIQQQNVEADNAIVSQAIQELVQKHAIEVEEKDKEIRNLAEKISTLQVAVDEYSLEMQSNVAKMETQQQELDLVKQTLIDKDSHLLSVQAELHSTKEEVARKQSELSQCSEDLQVLTSEKQRFLEDISNLEKQLNESETATTAVQEYAVRVQNLQQEIDGLRSALAENESIIHQYDRKFDESRLRDAAYKETVTQLQVQLQETDVLKNEIQNKTDEISLLHSEMKATRAALEETQKSLSEKVALLETTNQILNSKQMELDRLSNATQHQQQYSSSNIVDGLPLFRMGDSEPDNLQSTIDALRAELASKQEEVEHLKHILNGSTYLGIIQELQEQINSLYNEKGQLEYSLEVATKTITEKEKQLDDLKQQIQVQSQELVSKEETNVLSRDRRSIKDQEEVVRLQNELHAKEQEMNDLKYIIAEKDSQLSLQASMEPQSDDFELREMVQRLTTELYGKEQEIQHLRSTITELQKEITRLHEFERLSEEYKDIMQKLTAEKEHVRLEAEEFLERRLKEKEIEIDEIKQKLFVEKQKIVDDLQLKEKDIENLKRQLEESSVVEQKLNDNLHQKEEELLRVNADLAEKERRLAELSITKDAELHNLKVQIHEKEVRIEELLALSEEEEKQLVELRNTLDARETEINALKQLLEDKVKEYELIQRALKKDVPIIDPSAALSAESGSDQSKESASQELDLALYMLHQRDVRCEELTHELMQLLEERDTLQLRLSNAIRVNEELRRMGGSEGSPKKEVSSPPESEEPLVEHPSPSRSEGPVEIAKEAIDAPIGEDKEALALKLSQLHTVSHAKDVRLRDERELRHTQQMSLLAHKDVLSTLPPEAAARLVNANYTLSRDVQSQSSVLLNWLWGKSTPKVVHM